MNKYNLTTLKNGVRVVTIPIKGNQTIAVSIFGQAGSDYESKAENGISHFLEHMFFKGTKKRPKSIDVVKEFNSVGAIHNAATWNFMTAYYAKAGKKHFSKMFDVISDMYLNSLLSEEEIEKERGVILGEIDMYNDMPMYSVDDVHNKLLYGDQPSGRPIIGPKNNIKKFKQKDFINYRKKHYLGCKTIVAISGGVNHKDVVKEAKKIFSSLEKGSDIKQKRTKIKQKKQAIAIKRQKTEQTHLILSFRAPSQEDKDVSITRVLNALFGGYMSSRLFQRIRNELGLGYYVRSYYETFLDRGEFRIHMGVDNKRTVDAIKALLNEVRRIKEEKVEPEELDRAKKYLAGIKPLRFESSDDLASFYGSQFAGRYEKITTPGEMILKEKKVSRGDILRVAKKIFKNSNMNLAVVGPHTKAKFQKIFKL